MWGLGALRDGARGLVKQGAGAVRHGVEAGAKLLENLDENYEDEELEIYDEGSFDSGDSEAEGRRGGAEGSLVGEEEDDDDEPALGGKEAAPSVEGEELGGSQGDGGYAEVANEAANVAADDASNQQQKLPSEGDLYEALGLDPSSDEFKAVKHEMERLATDHSVELAGKEKHIKKLRREVRRVRQEAEVTVNEMQPQLRKLASMLKASKAEVENLEEQLSSTAEALQEETEGRRADFEALQAQLREERNEGDAEKEGLRQTVQMLQQEMADRNASLSEATKLLEQASARSAESEERTVALAREADELRERLSAIAANGDDRQELGGVAGEPGRGTSESTSLAAAEAALEQERSNVERLKQELARATCGSVDGETLGERTAELEKRPEEILSQELRDEVEFMKAKLQESETSGEEAMRAAATEAARAAEVREELETAEANLQEMRGRLAEYEEESVRMAELKGTLEITRDALDELRATASQDAATAERRLKEFQIQLKEACVERDHFRRQAESTAEVAKERLDALEARHEVGLKEATSRAETAKVSVETLREALVEARERAEALERKAADKATLDQDMERSLEEARGEGRELWARLDQQKTAADEELSAAIESRAEQDALLRTEADNVQELRSELEGRKREIQILQARADAAEAQARALKAPKAGDDSGDGNGDGNDGGIGSGGYGEDEEGSTERGEALDDLEAALRSRYGAEMEEALTGLRRELGEARKAREVASEELEVERRRVEEMMVTASELEERAGIAGKLEKEIADAAETMKREVAAREAAEVTMRELEKRREAEERAAGAALYEAEQRLEDARADLAATVEEMGRASVEGEAEIGSLKEKADATEGELRKLHATLETKAIEAVAAEEAARVEAVELRRQLDDARQKLAAESESQLAKQIDAAEAVARLEALERDLAAANQALRSTRNSEATAVADAAKALDARALAEDEVSALREEVVASKEEAHALRSRVSGAESTISGMDAARTELEQEVASLREDLAAIEAEHASSQERIRMELEEKWKPRLEEGVGVERARVAKMEREVQALRAKLSKAEEEHTRFSRESASVKEQAALAISEVEGAAQVAAWEVRSLREELKRARERSEELSSAAEEAREAVSASVRTELEGLREAVRVAEAAKEKAEDGLARMKDKRKRDLQEVRRLNERMMEQQDSRHDHVQHLETALSDLRAKVAALEERDARREEELANVLKDRDDLRQAAAQTPQTASTTSALYGAELSVYPGTEMQQSHQQQQQPKQQQETGRGSEVVPADGGGDEERQREREKADEQEKELSLLRKLVEKLQREVEGLKSDLKVAATGKREADDARESLAAALGRANARIAELTSKSAQLARSRSAMVAQIRALEEQVNAAALEKASSESAARFSSSHQDASEAAMHPAPPKGGTSTLEPPMRQRQRQRQGMGSVDLEHGEVSRTVLVGGQNRNDFMDDEYKTQPGDHVKALLMSCAISPVCAKATERHPEWLTWLQQLPPQRLWTAATVYLVLLHLVALYKTVVC